MFSLHKTQDACLKFRVRETEKSNKDFKGFLELYSPLDYEERNGYQIQLRACVSSPVCNKLLRIELFDIEIIRYTNIKIQNNFIAGKYEYIIVIYLSRRRLLG